MKSFSQKFFCLVLIEIYCVTITKLIKEALIEILEILVKIESNVGGLIWTLFPVVFSLGIPDAKN